MTTRVDEYFKSLILQASTPNKIGDALFDKFDEPLDGSGFVVRSFYTKYEEKGHFFILGWQMETSDGRTGVRTLTKPYVQSYMAFTKERHRNAVALYLMDSGWTFK